ncbi:threonine ammonia-lyase [Kitasatospora kifunensis]|uniref:Threonine dehydratase n=1 Tax=Kitasatospora kifunensis TaxID=58351 RepID=A0A7W7R8J1_KITKI|nr:pyridoxal-phosphate dependent enzyme [Kitasatospora kifunensis]MBB4927259.1 threonine dehydratase [Kitasatospora kifunensis]
MTSVGTGLGPADVLAAADRIAARVRRTPLLAVPSLPGILLKAEHLQHTGSFKLRGAANAMLGAGSAAGGVRNGVGVGGVRNGVGVGVGGIVTGSSGNHGIAVAGLSRSLGVGATVVMAAGASEEKARLIRALGARVVVVAGGVAEREQRARELAATSGALFVPSSDHELVVAGQGTVGLEVFADAPELAAIFVPVGGGGLLAGVCLAAQALARPVRIIGVEPLDARRYFDSLAAGHPVQVPPTHTLADGLRGQSPGEVPLPIIRQRVDELIGVGDEAIAHAMDLLHRAGVEAEPSGSVALAGALACAGSWPPGVAGRAGPVAVVVSGGNTAAALAALAVLGHQTPPSQTDNHVDKEP